MFDEFALDVRKIALSPRNPTPIPFSQTVGYFHGDVPSIFVHVGGDRYILQMGQCIPVGGRDVSIENPFSRSAKVQVSLNAAPTMQASPNNAEQRGFVTFRSATGLYYDPARTEGFMGVGLLATSGRYLVKYSTKSNMNLIVYSDADPVNMANKPDDFMPYDLKFEHLKNAKLDTIIGMYGYYTQAGIDEWVTSAGLPLGSHKDIYRGVTEGYFLMEPNTAFVMKAGVGGFTESSGCNIEIEELASLDGARYA